MAISLAVLVFLLLIFGVPLLYLLSVKKQPAPHRAGDGGKRLPPSPPGLPLLGHLHLLGSLPHRALWSLAVAHGPVLLIWLGRVPTVLVSSAAAAEEVMRARDLAFASRPKNTMAERLLYGRDVAFAPYGEYWRTTRRICTVHLLSSRRTLSFRRVREEEAAALVERVRSHASVGTVVGLSELLIAYTNTIVSRAAFGDESARGLYEGSDRGCKLRKVFAVFEELLGTMPVGELVPALGWLDTLRGLEGKLRMTFEALDPMLEKVIDDHRRRRRHGGRQQIQEHDDQRDFVDVLLDVNEMDKEAGIRIGTVEIKAIIMDMFVAGTSATTTALEWTMAELVNHPRHMHKLQDEIRAAVGGADLVGEDHLDKVRYLKAVLKETLRLHPPIPLLVPREPPADAEILGHHVPARTQVVINAWAIGRDPVTWERPEEFCPERFLDGTVDLKGRLEFELVPFGAGRRGCPGVGFATPTLEMALASLLYHFDWEPAGGSRSRPGTPLDMTEVNGLAVRVKCGLPLIAKPWFPCTGN